MSVYNFINGDDVNIFADNNALCSVLSLEIKETVTYYEVPQYLSGEPTQRIPIKKEYDLILKKRLTGCGIPEDNSGFSLDITYPNNKRITYEPCCLLQKEQQIAVDKTLLAVYKIRAYNRYEGEA